MPRDLRRVTIGSSPASERLTARDNRESEKEHKNRQGKGEEGEGGGKEGGARQGRGESSGGQEEENDGDEAKDREKHGAKRGGGGESERGNTEEEGGGWASSGVGEKGEEKKGSRRGGWGTVRMYTSREQVVVEDDLKSNLRDHHSPVWLYQAARDYAERYDSRYGTGLIPDSAPMVQEIADFWRDYYGLDR